MSFRLEHRIGIAAPVAVVWDVLADLEGWADWNPLNPRAAGRLSIGAPLELELQVPGEPATVQKVSVIDWVPNAQLVWAAKYGGGLITSARYLELEALTDQGCVFSNGELYNGLAARFIPRRLRARTRQGFAGLGEALKRRVETGRGAP